MVGTGFMARAHSNAYLQVSRFFGFLVTPVLYTVCGRNLSHLKNLVDQFGWKKGVYSLFPLPQLIEYAWLHTVLFVQSDPINLLPSNLINCIFLPSSRKSLTHCNTRK